MPSKARFYHIWTLGRKQSFSSSQSSLFLESEIPPWSRQLLWEEGAGGFSKLFRWKQVPIHSGKIPYPDASVWARRPADRGSSSQCAPFPCEHLHLLMFPGVLELPDRKGRRTRALCLLWFKATGRIHGLRQQLAGKEDGAPWKKWTQASFNSELAPHWGGLELAFEASLWTHLLHRGRNSWAMTACSLLWTELCCSTKRFMLEF